MHSAVTCDNAGIVITGEGRGFCSGANLAGGAGSNDFGARERDAGAALALSGYPWVGAPLVLIGILLPRYIKKQAPKILLHLAQSDAKTYQEAIEYEILEVRMTEG